MMKRGAMARGEVVQVIRSASPSRCGVTISSGSPLSVTLIGDRMRQGHHLWVSAVKPARTRTSSRLDAFDGKVIDSPVLLG
jgi:hypothetical protein